MGRHLVLLVATMSTMAAPIGGQSLPLLQNLGRYHYAVNGWPDAQAYFDQGLRLFWSGEPEAAARSFREGERQDPGCAMCAYGVALAGLFPDLAPGPRRPPPPDSAIAALRRARAAVRGGIEAQLIDALLLRQSGRDSSFTEALGNIVAANPGDAEARMLLALALLHQGRGELSAAGRFFAVIDTVLRIDPLHPGACHLLVLAVEWRDPASALPCARRLAESMPGARLVKHLPARLYRGMVLAASMQGASGAALDAAARIRRAVDPGVASAVPEVDALTPIPSLTLVTFGQWDRILAEPLPRPATRYATGMAYYARGVAFAAKRRWAEARAALDSVSRIAGAHPEGARTTALLIAERALAGEIALRRGNPRDAVREFRSAAMLQDGAPRGVWYYPLRHSLGLALIKAGRFREAEQAYRQDLDRHPGNGWALYGLAQTLKAQRRMDEAGAALERFNRAWSGADVALRGSRF